MAFRIGISCPCFSAELKHIEMSLEKAITVFIPNNVAHIVVNNSDKDFILLAYTDKLYDPKDTIPYNIK